MASNEAKKKYRVGYTQGVFDMFHIGHLNLLKNSKEQCDYLIVGVNSDILVKTYKHKQTVIPECSRLKIVDAIKYVDRSLLSHTLDKKIMYEQLHFDVIFIGNDWKGNERWKHTEEDLRMYGVDVVYLPYTEGISSTGLLKSEEKRVYE